MLIRLLLIGLLVVPAAAWAFFKPIRVVAPKLAGLSCPSVVICTDDAARYQEAVALYDEALRFVQSSIGPTQKNPRVVFCSTDPCFQSFGLGNRSAATIGSFGIVVSPRAWKPHYVRHEMIHHLQGERLGILVSWLKPQWFTEGMAYALSEDPRAKLAEPFDRYRCQFQGWYKGVGKERVWQEAGKL